MTTLGCPSVCWQGENSLLRINILEENGTNMVCTKCGFEKQLWFGNKGSYFILTFSICSAAEILKPGSQVFFDATESECKILNFVKFIKSKVILCLFLVNTYDYLTWIQYITWRISINIGWLFSLVHIWVYRVLQILFSHKLPHAKQTKQKQKHIRHI